MVIASLASTGITFDWTINIGHISAIVVGIAAGFAFVFAMKSELRSVAAGVGELQRNLKGFDEEIKEVKDEMKKIGDVMTQIAVQKNELENMNKRMDDLQHGRGFVLDGLPRAIKSGRS